MHKIFIGMLLVFLDAGFTVDNSRIGVIPDFIGYIFMLKGLSEMTEFSPRFSKITPYVKGAMIYSGIIYILDLSGFGPTIVLSRNIYPLELFNFGSLVNLSFMAYLVLTIIGLYISYNIIMGVKDIEDATQKNLNFVQLYSMWKLRVIFLVLGYVIIIFALIAMIVIIILEIRHLFIFNKTRKSFYDTCQR